MPRYNVTWTTVAIDNTTMDMALFAKYRLEAERLAKGKRGMYMAGSRLS